VKFLLPTAAIVVLAGLVAVVVALRSDDDTGNPAGVFVEMTPGVLTVATEFPAPGFWDGANVRDVTGGFEAELADELAVHFGLERVVVVDRPFESLVSGEATGFDLALAQISITRDRRQVVDLSSPYLTTTVGVVGRPALDVPDLEAARQLRWGVAAGTTEADVVHNLVRPETDETTYRSTSALVAAAARGEIDVAALDLARALAETDRTPDVTLLAQVNAPQHYGALLPKGSRNLEAVNSALRTLRADGTLRDLEDLLYEDDRPMLHDLPVLRVTP
jgi:polar amino acid transport system substrate-binding protein